jgi:hypothetical protein
MNQIKTKAPSLTPPKAEITIQMETNISTGIYTVTVQHPAMNAPIYTFGTRDKQEAKGEFFLMEEIFSNMNAHGLIRP